MIPYEQFLWPRTYLTGEDMVILPWENQIIGTHNTRTEKYTLVTHNTSTNHDYTATNGDILISQQWTYTDDYSTNNYTTGNYFWNFKSLSEKEIKKEKLKKQHRSNVRLRGRPSFIDSLNPTEVKALQLLKSLVSAENFRKYLKYGFVTVKGLSGLQYDIYRIQRIKVFDGHIQVAKLCVHLKGNQPPTDEVIAKVLMCECSEHEIWQRSNKYFCNKTPKITNLGFDRKAA